MLWTLDIHLIFVLSIGHFPDGKSSNALSQFIFSILGLCRELQVLAITESSYLTECYIYFS
ncbi:MAG: hypothetical protein C0632_09180 [Vibrio alginolyticus]|nr:MAG: hypothetical protein C0632_09180 [Vibrio alginolyticus]TNC15545.1 hypothetical protein FHG74_00030 [Vibrio diabolicus]